MQKQTTACAPAARPLLRIRDPRQRVVVCTGDACPRCRSQHVARWGRFAGRRRFRCRGCGRTFSTFTGTPLHYLKAIDRWPAFVRGMNHRDSIRRCAARADVDPTTSFRWRHRLLADMRRRDDTALAGLVHLHLTWLAHNRKGSRSIAGRPRRHGFRYPSRVPIAERVSIALLWHSDVATRAFPSTAGALAGRWLAEVLPPNLDRTNVLLTHLALPRSGVVWPRDLRIARPGRGGAEGDDPHPRLTLRLHRWLRPFRGVATRYLANYLQWFRSDVARGRDGGVSGPGPNSGPLSQQFPQTEPEWTTPGGERRRGGSGRPGRRGPP